MKHVVARAIGCTMLMVLPSCGIPKLRQPEGAPDLPPSFGAAANPAPDQPPGYNGGASPAPDQSANSPGASIPRTAQPANSSGATTPTSDQLTVSDAAACSGTDQAACSDGATCSPNSSQIAIEDFFSDPTLTSLIGQALAGNRELKVLNEEVQIAGNEIRARRGAYLPFGSFGASAELEKNSLYTPLGAVEENVEFLPDRFFPTPLPNYALGLNFFWELDIWRALRNARDAARERYFAAIEQRNFFVTRLVAEVAENYYHLMALDQRLLNLDNTIALQEKSLKLAQAEKEAGRGTELGVQRFLAEVRKNQSEKLIVSQEIVQVENRINFLANRFPQPVERMSAGFFDLQIHALCVGMPAQLLQNRPDIRQAERELAAAGLDVRVARAHFYPRLSIAAGVGYEAFNPRYFFNTPDALIYNVAGDLVAPLINRAAIKAEYRSANSRQLQKLYDYQRTVLNAFTEVVNRVSRVQNYSKSIDIKKQQLQSLESSVDVATKLFQSARAEYVDVLLAQRDLMDAKMVLIETKQEQLAAIVNAYQALGGGLLSTSIQQAYPGAFCAVHRPQVVAEAIDSVPLQSGTEVESGSGVSNESR